MYNYLFWCTKHFACSSWKLVIFVKLIVQVQDMREKLVMSMSLIEIEIYVPVVLLFVLDESAEPNVFPLSPLEN